jgi:hypothetical protein
LFCSNSGFGLIVCTSKGKIYFWRDIEAPYRFDSNIVVKESENCVRLIILDPETISITTMEESEDGNMNNARGNLFFISLKVRIIL